MGKLYIVATPIGNLKDVTLRALEVLQSVDGIICEDTRRTSILLHHYSIKKPLQVLNDFNESRMVDILVELVKDEDWALVSDAGTPLISDPGFKLVRECKNRGIEVDSIPGPSAAITALTLSGLSPDRFLFVGYPPEKSGQRIKWMEGLKIKTTVIMYAAPHKLIRILQDLKEVFGDIEVVLASELTKMHQSVDKKTISKCLENLHPKGEYTLLFRLSD